MSERKDVIGDVSERLNLKKAGVKTGDFGERVLFFKGVLSPKTVLELAERLNQSRKTGWGFLITVRLGFKPRVVLPRSGFRSSLRGCPTPSSTTRPHHRRLPATRLWAAPENS